LEPPVSPDEPPDPAGAFDDPDPGAEMSLVVRRDGALLDSDSWGGFGSDDFDSFDTDDLDSDADDFDSPFLESDDDPESEDALASDGSLAPALASAGSLSFEGSAGRVPSGR
jgi:hypothetical protein